MNTQSTEEPRALGIQTDDEKKQEIGTAFAKDTARRLKTNFSEPPQSGAMNNPEAGCVAWYHFPQSAK